MARRVLSEIRVLRLLLTLLLVPPEGPVSAQEVEGGRKMCQLVAPQDRACILPGRLEFRWEGVDSVSILQIARDSAFADLVLSDSIAPKTFMPPRGLLRNDSAYFWRVGVRDSSSEPLFSPPRLFTVAPSLGLSSETLFLGYVPNGDTAWASATLRNPMPFPITLDSIGCRSEPFRIPRSLPAVIDSLDSLILPVRFIPRGFLIFSDSIRLQTSLGERVIVVAGDSPPPLCRVGASTLQFGAVANGDTASAVLAVHNGGVVNSLRVHRLSHRSGAFQIRKTFPFAIAAQDSVLLRVRFVPGALRPAFFGSLADTLLIESDGGSALIGLFAESPPPRLRAIPERVDFGEAATQDSAIRTVRLTNESVNALRIDSLRVGRGGFSAGPFQGTVRARDTVLVRVRFLPLQSGDFRDTLRVYGKAPARRFFIPLKGTAPPPLLVADRAALQFGEIPHNEPGRLVLGISNNSISPLAIDSIVTGTGAFRVERFPVFARLRRGDTLHVQITFLPDTAGFFRDTLVIASNSSTPRVLIPLSGVGRIVGTAGEDAAGSFALYQNFPNPFNEMTTFRYALPERCTVRLAVYNSLGQIIATVVDGEQEEGYHNVIWRAEAASGMYIVKLIAVATGNPDRHFVASRRLMMLR